jgi:hypothetical protein
MGEAEEKERRMRKKEMEWKMRSRGARRGEEI